tara:strand:- start:1263 stop:1880 length:618 start_codon:yes stop_codon:yes gene_type:complete
MSTDEHHDQNQFEELIQGMIDNNYGYCDNFISPSTVQGLRDNLKDLNKLGELKASGLGNKKVVHINKKIRGDKIHWIDNASINPSEIIYLNKINKFVEHLNNTCFTAINSFESHYSTYEKTKFYKRHLDQFKSEKGRQFSIILYLNKDWKDTDEGALSLYPKNGAQKNITPSGGRLVFFRSDEMEHEVQPSNTRERRSIAGWLKR